MSVFERHTLHTSSAALHRAAIDKRASRIIRENSESTDNTSRLSQDLLKRSLAKRLRRKNEALTLTLTDLKRRDKANWRKKQAGTVLPAKQDKNGEISEEPCALPTDADSPGSQGPCKKAPQSARSLFSVLTEGTTENEGTRDRDTPSSSRKPTRVLKRQKTLAAAGPDAFSSDRALPTFYRNRFYLEGQVRKLYFSNYGNVILLTWFSIF